MVTQEDINTWRAELVGYLKQMAEFSKSNDYADILMDISAMTARASTMRALVVGGGPDYCRRFRLDEIDPFLKEADRQFKVWSRVIAVHSQEWQNNR